MPNAEGLISENGHSHGPLFALKDCTLVAVATGRRAQTLRELRHHLGGIGDDCVYHHFWGHRLQPRFDDVEYHNDFARWAHESIQDGWLAERLSVLDPADFVHLEALRREVIDLVDERLHHREPVRAAPPDRKFHFLESRVVVFDTGRRVDRPEALPDLFDEMSSGSLFYHVVDARRRHPRGLDDFRLWLSAFGRRYEALNDELASIDPYFLPLGELRRRWSETCRNFFEQTQTGSTMYEGAMS